MEEKKSPLVMKNNVAGYDHYYDDDVCKFLDTCLNEGNIGHVSYLGAATYVCDFRDDEPDIKLIRVPGATRGCIHLNNNIITDMRIYDDSFDGPVACYKPEFKDAVTVKMNEQIGKELVLEWCYESSEDEYYTAFRRDNLYAFKAHRRVDPDAVWDAASYCAMSILKYLIEELGMDVDYDAPGTAKNTPFKQACAKGHIEACKYLIERGTDTSGLDIHISRSDLAMQEYLGALGLNYRFEPDECSCPG